VGSRLIGPTADEPRFVYLDPGAGLIIELLPALA
jgi:hypothetical protein